ncbi:hypothetical protein EDB81DRAFT_808653 [Dactylonectria macrodidyma]|uniref:Uncharacterized protein n=1 Tax=Dactylonectria macrodidyma TaxID=307937 RepID=A0A9P9IQS2_9HYPO|nr:hypothetical protein EDB81DRAFT_808653 [Dactylonectria macrodidyma]
MYCMKLLMNAPQPITREYEMDCRATPDLSCGHCDCFAAEILQTLISSFRTVEDLFDNTTITSVCGRGECKDWIRKEVQDTLSAAIRYHCLKTLGIVFLGECWGAKHAGRW